MRQELLSSLTSPRPAPPAARPILKVPFGLKDGRMWSAKQVPHGKACGCVCPACQAPLVAKAAESTRRRAHFAHLVTSDCQAGYETALHLKAKELIAEHLRLWLPAWDGEEGLPNPPSLVDDFNCPLYGRKVDFPCRQVTLLSARIEQSCGDYIPDVVGIDEEGELLIEIRVSHAVDDLKRRRIQSEGKRLIEIDLSDLSRRQEVDEDTITCWVLDQVSNRTWLSCPAATDEWRASHRDLKTALVTRNQEIAEVRRRHEEQVREQQRARERAALADAERLAKKERFRLQQRSPYQRELEALPELVSAARIESLLNEYEARDANEAKELLALVQRDQVRHALRIYGSNAWIYLVHPSLWQAAAYHQFVHDKPAGTRFNRRDVAAWVRQEFGKEEDLYTLFMAQYKATVAARKAGFAKVRISNWAFTEFENRQIPSFYDPINAMIERLVRAKVIEYLPEPRGEMRIC